MAAISCLITLTLLTFSPFLCPLLQHNDDNHCRFGRRSNSFRRIKQKEEYIEYFWLPRIILPFRQNVYIYYVKGGRP